MTVVQNRKHDRRKGSTINDLSVKLLPKADCITQDVSGLFPDVLKNMQTEDLEQKKLVYLYLINYAKTQPELVILAVNTFVKVRYLCLISLLLCNGDGPLISMNTGHR